MPWHVLHMFQHLGAACAQTSTDPNEGSGRLLCNSNVECSSNNIKSLLLEQSLQNAGQPCVRNPAMPIPLWPPFWRLRWPQMHVRAATMSCATTHRQYRSWRTPSRPGWRTVFGCTNTSGVPLRIRSCAHQPSRLWPLWHVIMACQCKHRRPCRSFYGVKISCVACPLSLHESQSGPRASQKSMTTFSASSRFRRIL